MMNQQTVLQQLIKNINQQSLGHAILIHGIEDNEIFHQLTLALLCQNIEEKPCLSCKSCQLQMHSNHPDYIEIKPEKKNTIIKVEAIRALINNIYISPQMGGNKIIHIKHADKLNQSSANALLKILEEPPTGIYFILYAKHLNNLLPTIISRCQLWSIPQPSLAIEDFSQFKTAMADESEEWLQVADKTDEIIQDLIEIIKDEKSICTIAAKWSKYDLLSLCHILYWLNSNLIYQHWGNIRNNNHLIKGLYPLLKLSKLFLVLELQKG